MIPYVTPVDLLGDPSAPTQANQPSDAATLGIDFSQFANDRIWDLCRTATNMADSFCNNRLRCTEQYDQVQAPGHRLGMWGDYSARMVTTRKPILSVLAAQTTWGGPPYTWTTIPADQVVPQDALVTAGTINYLPGAGAGTAALIIGNASGLWSFGRLNTVFGATYLAGFPHCAIQPAAQTTATLTINTNTITVASATGLVDGAPIFGTGIPTGATITGIAGTTITISSPANSSGTGVAVATGYPAGVTTLKVDDVTGWNLGFYAHIYDGIDTEWVGVSAATADVPGGLTPTGTGTVTLEAATQFPHQPYVALSTMPEAVRWAVMLGVKRQVLERGAPAISATSLAGRSVTAKSAIAEAKEGFESHLLPYRRTY